MAEYKPPTDNYPLGNIPLSYRGVFDFERVYRSTHNWMLSHQMKYHETLYKSKPQPGGGREVEITVMGEVKLDDMHKWVVDVSTHVWDGVEVEVTQGNEKRKMWRGRIQVTIKGVVQRDYQGNFNTPFLLKLRHLLLNKMMFWEEGFKQWDTYYYHMISLQAELKRVLDLYTAANYF